MKQILKILILAAILLLPLCAGLIYLNRVVLPVKAKQWAEEAASKALGRPVTIERVHLHLWHGFMAEGVSVQEDPTRGQGPFLRIDKVSGAVLLVPLVKHREIIIPTLHIQGGDLRLLQSTQGRWNLEDLLNRPPAARVVTPTWRFLLPRIVLSGSQVSVQMEQGHPLLLHLHEVQAEVQLGLPSKVEGTLEAKVEVSSPGGPDRFIDLNGTAALDWKLEGNLRGPFSLSVWWETEGFRVAGPQPITSGWADEPPAQLRWEGDLSGQIQANIPSWPPPEGWRDFQGLVRLNRGKLWPIPTVQELREISGEIVVSPEGIRTESLTATLPTGPVLQATGSVLADNTRSFGVRLSGESSIEQLPTLPAAAEKLRKSVNPSGQIQIEALVNGALKPSASFRPVVTMRFQDAAFTLPNQQTIQKASGTLYWQPDLVTFTDVHGQFLEKPFQLEGSLVNFAQPEIDARMSWNEMSAEGQLAVDSERIELHAVKGRIGSGTFRLLGELAWPHPTTRSRSSGPPAEGGAGFAGWSGWWGQANLLAEGTVLLQELPRLWPTAFAALEKHAAQGEASFRCLVEGNLARPEERAVDLKLSAPSLQIRSFTLKQLALDLNRREQQVRLSSARAHYAGGTVLFSGGLDLRDERRPWSGRIAVEGAQMDQLASDLKWGTRNLSGQLSGEWEGRGEAVNLAALSGTGSLRVAGARMLELPLLGGFANLLGLPSLERIIFQEAQGRFALGEGKIQTGDLQLRAPQATLTILGEAGFLKGAESPIRLRILPTLSPELIPEETRSKIGKVIAQGAGYFIGEVEISGTWKNPRRKFISKPVTQILNEQLFNLQDILDELF